MKKKKKIKFAYAYNKTHCNASSSMIKSHSIITLTFQIFYLKMLHVLDDTKHTMPFLFTNFSFHKREKEEEKKEWAIGAALQPYE